jgi:hypothetical protein
MTDLTRWIVSSGFLAAIFILIVTIRRQRRFEFKDVGGSVVAYFAGSNIPAAIYLCWYGFAPDPSTVLTKLHGYEKYVAFGGLCILLVSLISLWGLIKNAYEGD